MRKIFLLFILLLVTACATVEEKTHNLVLGMTPDEAKFAMDDKKYKVVERRKEEDGEVEIRRYGSYNDAWDLIFKNGTLTGWRKVPPVEEDDRSGVRFGIGLQHMIIRD